MIPLRPYQQRACDGVLGRFARAVRRVLLVLPTGGGKTVIASALVNAAIEMGRPVVFLAHRRELIKQTFAKLLRNGLAPDQVGVIMAGVAPPAGHLFRVPSLAEATDDQLWQLHGRWRPAAPVQVGSIDTFRNRAKPRAGLVIVDEAHRALAKSYVDVQKAYPDAWHLGLTATPFRADGKGLGDAYDDLVVAATFGELVGESFLVPPRCFGARRQADLKGVKVSAGDYNQEQLARAVNKAELIGDIIEHWKTHGNDAPTFAFAVDVAHSMHLAQRFNAAGIPARHVDGATEASERDDAIAALRDGRVRVLCNCNVFTEGTDVPSVKTIVLARPTKSEGLYLQQAGRGARPHQGQEFVVLDHAGCCTEFGLPQEPREYSLEGRKKREVGIATPRGKRCPNCGAILPYSARECPPSVLCSGYVWPTETPVAEPPKEAAGKLVELTPGQRKTLGKWDALVEEWRRENEKRVEDGLRPVGGGWCRAVWRRRTGNWPPKGSKLPELTAEEEQALAVEADRNAVRILGEQKADADRRAQGTRLEQRPAQTALEEWRV